MPDITELIKKRMRKFTTQDQPSGSSPVYEDRGIRTTTRTPANIIHEFYVDPDVDVIEEGCLNDTPVDGTNTAITLHKADGTTNVQAPTNSDLVIVIARLTGNGGGSNSSRTCNLRGTSTADNAGSSADDLIVNVAVTGTGGGGGNPNTINENFIVLPAGKFLTLVNITTGGSAPPTLTMRCTIVGKEAF